ncbi:MAG: preprotein translocase subunit SecY [Endomicrobium sp.]|nr:preprotein translocase subunit SecY [Endomicrobium sp.]
MKKITDVFKMSEFKKKILFTLFIIVVYRIGATIPIPGINSDAVKSLFATYNSGLLGFLDMFSGGALNRMSIFSLGVMPYINASIIMGLLQSAHIFQYLDKLSNEGNHGRKKLVQITRFGTVIFAIVQSFGIIMIANKIPVSLGVRIVTDFSLSWIISSVITLVSGTVLIMWLGEQITERGIGNGVSLIIFAGIVERIPSAIFKCIKLLNTKELNIFYSLSFVFIIFVILISVVWIETAQRKIPVHYAKRIVGRKIYDKQMSFLPIKINQAGVISVIFAVSVLSMPLMLFNIFPKIVFCGFNISEKFINMFNNNSIVYNIVFVLLIVFFCYFYNSISFNPKDLADNMKKMNGFIPGIRPGSQTELYIKNILEKITLTGALFVAFIAVLPDFLKRFVNLPFFFGGTSLLIVVGIALDTIGQIESYFIMKNYEDFIKKSNLKKKWFNV